MGRRRMSITQTQLAKHLGVSQHTVSVAFGGAGRISDETRRKVLEQAKRLRYRPNAAARSMRSGAFRNVALLSTTDNSIGNLPKELLRGAQQAAEKDDLTLMVTEHPLEELTRAGFQPRILRERLVDGLLINYHREAPTDTVRLFRSFNLPMVWLNAVVDDPCVHPDDLGAGRRAAEHLLSLGHRRIAYVSHHGERHYSVVDRCRGVEAALREAGLELAHKELLDGYSKAQGVDHVTRWLSESGRPTAAICYEQQEAVCVYVSAMRLGLRIPQDLSVVAFGSDVLRSLVGLPITTFTVPFEELGRQAMGLLATVTRAKDPSTVASVALRFGFENAGSTAAPGQV